MEDYTRRTINRRLRSHLGATLNETVANGRRCGWTWQEIADQITRITRITVTRTTLAAWYPHYNQSYRR